MIKAVYFDLDGVLFDRDRAEIETLKYFNQTLWRESEFDSVYHYWKTINLELWKKCSEGYIAADDVLVIRWEKMLEKLGGINTISSHMIAKVYIKRYSDSQYKIELDNVLDMLKQKKYRMAVITNGVKTVQNIKIGRANLNSYFDYIVTDQDSGFRKPNLGMFEYVLNLHKINACEAIYIGDSYEDDIVPAKKLGMIPILFSTNRNLKIVEKSNSLFRAFDEKSLYNTISDLLR